MIRVVDSGALDTRRHVAIATGTRADWGLLSPIARGLSQRNDVKISIIATNMHLDSRFGNTISEIENDGFEVAERVPIIDCSAEDSPLERAKATGRATIGFAEALSRLKPDMLVILGDRFEILGAATAAQMMRVPVVHISGGEITRGAIDDSLRHAITKLAALHLTATETYRRRVINMGEPENLVINTGAIGVDNLMRIEPLTPGELEKQLGVRIDRNTLLVTYHPVTLSSNDISLAVGELLAALDRFPDSTVIFTYPNNDAGGDTIIPMIKKYATDNPGRVALVASLGRVRYLSALKAVGAVVGNSSSGIVEVPSAHIPTVNIGNRQEGRLASRSVINCGESADEISAAITEALSEEGRLRAEKSPNPYHKADTLSKMVEAIAETPLSSLSVKHFTDPFPLENS